MKQELEQDADCRAGDISYKAQKGNNELGTSSAVINPLEKFTNWTWINQTFLMQKKKTNTIKDIHAGTHFPKHLNQHPGTSADGHSWAQVW